MNIIYPLIITSIAGLSTVLGNVLLFVNTKYKDMVISFSMGLSFVVMFLISILELIPEGILLLIIRFNIFQVFIICFSMLFVGYLFVNILDKRIDNNDSLYKIGFLSMLSLFIHNVPEGIICALTSSNSLDLGLRMSFIIMVHNIPEGICISLPIYYSTGSRGKAFFMTVVSSFGEIFGALISIMFLDRFVNDYIMSFILIITAGIMISLSVLKILKEGLSLKAFKWLFLGVLVGIGIIIVTL